MLCRVLIQQRYYFIVLLRRDKYRNALIKLPPRISVFSSVVQESLREYEGEENVFFYDASIDVKYCIKKPRK